MQGGLPYLLPTVFGFSVVAMLLIYWIGGKVSTKSNLKNTIEKTAPYACGEDFPAEELKIDLERFFIFAVYFLIFDVVAFILATSFSAMSWIPIGYCLIVLMTAIMFLSFRRHL